MGTMETYELKIKEEFDVEYSYNDFVEDLKLGSEIEFTYNNINYFLFYDERGTILVKLDDKTKQIFRSIQEFLSSKLFQSKRIYEVWDDISINTVL
jgi:hypothetical protein